MKYKKQSLGPLGLQFFAWIQLQNRDRLQVGDLMPSLGISAKQERELLSRLCRNGFIVRLQRGTYLVPQKIPPGGKWMPTEYVLISELMDVLGAEYFISGPTAFQYYGLTNQVPQVICVYNDKISGYRKVGNLNVQFVLIPDNRMGGWTTIDLPNGKSVRIATLARAILDAIYDWPRFNTLPRAYDWLEKYKKDKTLMRDIALMALQYGNVSSRRRLGFIFEKIGVDQKYIRKLSKVTPQSQGWIPLVPTLPVRGKTDPHWRLVING